MAKFRQMQDMARTPAEKKEVAAEMVAAPSAAGVPDYPWGLSISLCTDELEKLDLDDMPEVGDMIHLFAMAKVTAISSRDTDAGPEKRLELQITHLGVEDEDTETEPDEDPAPRRRRPGRDYRTKMNDS